MTNPPLIGLPVNREARLSTEQPKEQAAHRPGVSGLMPPRSRDAIPT